MKNRKKDAWALLSLSLLMMGGGYLLLKGAAFTGFFCSPEDEVCRASTSGWFGGGTGYFLLGIVGLVVALYRLCIHLAHPASRR
jgi:hypothetical protein